MRPSARLAPLFVALLTATAVAAAGVSVAAQAQPRRPAPQQPRAPQGRTPAPAPQTAKPAPKPAAAPAPPPAPVHQDVRFKTAYTTGGLKTESVAYMKGPRERFEFQDMVLLKQHDLKRTIQISRSANTYLVAPDGAPTVPTVPGAVAAPPKPPGVVMLATTIVDTGERKTAFGQQARRVKTVIDRQPMPGACDATKQHIESDGWYIDMPKALAGQAPSGPADTPADGCADQVQATATGDPKALGFPIGYTTTITGEDGKPVVAAMEIVEFELTTLDAALFEIPPGLNASASLMDLSKALSDVSEAKLVATDTAPAATPLPRTPGVVRVGVPEFTNKTQQSVDTRALRQRLVADLAEAKIEAVPMAAAPQAELQKRAAELGYAYVLLAEVTELKASKPGRFGGLARAASGIAGGRGGVAGVAGAAAGVAGAAAAPKDTTESTIALKLIAPDGKQRLSTTTKGKDGSGFTLQTGLGLAKFAGGMYINMLMAPMMMASMGGLGGANLGGMGLLGNPALFRMQMGGLGGLSGLGTGAGIDTTAGAASFLMQQAMTMNAAGGLVGLPGQGPSYDESLGEAVEGAAKAVAKSLQQK